MEDTQSGQNESLVDNLQGDDDSVLLTEQEAIGTLTILAENLRGKNDWQSEEKLFAAAKLIEESKYSLSKNQKTKDYGSAFQVIKFNIKESLDDENR